MTTHRLFAFKGTVPQHIRIVGFLLLVVASSFLYADAAPTPPTTPTGFTASVYLSLNPDTDSSFVGEEGTPFARFFETVEKMMVGQEIKPGGFRMPGQFYYNATTQKIRLDSAVSGGFVATFNLYGANEEWIYTFSNVHGATCQKYPLKGAFPPPTWLTNCTFVNETQVWGTPAYHWHGVGNRIGPALGPPEYDFYSAIADGSFLLLENTAFQQFFVDMHSRTADDTIFDPPSICPQ